MKNNTVKFVNYTGSYPCYCTGTLTVEINGETVQFGRGANRIFWRSAGESWRFSNVNFPEKYAEYFSAVCDVFNENVEAGCCGGCK